MHRVKVNVVADALPLNGVGIGVLEGDVKVSLDADRLAHWHVPVTKLNIEPRFGGECHLDAERGPLRPAVAPARRARSPRDQERWELGVPHGIQSWRGRPRDGVRGHGVCGQAAQVPTDVPGVRPVVINKVDLLEHLGFDLDLFPYRLDAVHPGVEHMLLSARSGEGLDTLRGWVSPAAGSDAFLTSGEPGP